MDDKVIFVIGGIIIIFGLMLLIIGKNKLSKRDNHDLENEVTNLMYEQHRVLFGLIGKLFDQEKIEESFFFEKRKLLSGSIDKDHLLNFLDKGKEDILFIQGLKTTS